MQLYIVSVLSLVVSILLFGLFYLYKQYNSLLVKINQLTFDLNNLQNTNEGDNLNNNLNNVFSNPELMSSFLNGGMADEYEGEEDVEEVEGDDDDIENEEDGEYDDEDDNEDDEDEDDEDEDDEEIEVNDNEVDDDEEIELNDNEVELVEDDEVELVEDDENILDDDVKIITSSSPSLKKRSVPNEPAKDYDVGHQLVSGNDNNMYEVIANKNGVKRWKKIKTE